MNNLQVRNANKKRILNYLYQNDGASKRDIMRALGLSAPTVSLILKDLAQRGLVRKSGTLESSGGRRPAANSLVYDARLSAGMEITHNHLRFALIDMGETMRHSRKLRRIFHNDPAYFQQAAQELENFLNDCEVDRSRLLGVGIALPGIVDARRNLLTYSPTLPVTNLSLDVFRSCFPYPLRAGNEAKLAGFTEIWKMDGTEDAVYLSVNKGVGGAILIGNKLFCGTDGRAGEFGHMTIVKDGMRCSCGKAGCLEAYCSTRMLTEPDFDDVDDFFAALEAGNRYCREKWGAYLDYLATGVNSLYTIFDTNIILGGEISGHLQKYADVFRQKLTELSPFGTRAGYLHFSQFGDNASAIGGALLLVDSFLNS